MHIYFAHAISDYDTDYEELCLNLINNLFKDCKIHNPKDLNKLINKNMPEPGRFKAYFFPEILKCDTLIAAPVFNNKKNNEFNSGTKKEIAYALSHKKQVWKIVNISMDITITKIETSGTGELICKGCKQERNCLPKDFALCQGDGYNPKGMSNE